MKLQINGESRTFDAPPAPFTLAALLDALGMKPDRLAVELNRNIVSRDRWAQTQLQEGDQLEIVHFVRGGLGLDVSLGSSLVRIMRPCRSFSYRPSRPFFPS